MAAIVHDTTVITPRGERIDTLEHHSLVFQDGRITELAPSTDFDQRIATGEFTEVIHADHHIVIPGLINTHHHLYQSLTRCLPVVQDIELFNWLRRLYEHWRFLDHEAVNVAAQVSIAELLLHGCTTTSDHFYMLPPGGDARMEAVLEAAETLGIRIHLCRGSMSLGHSGGGLPPDDCVERDADVLADCQRVLDAYHDPSPHAMRRIDLAPCSPFNVTRELMRDTRIMARERGVLLHTHLAETRDEERFCIEKYGCRPVQYLADLDWLGPDVYLAHCVYLSDDEIDLFAKTGTGVSHNPTSNLRLGSGIAPVRKMLAAGVRVGIAVDGSSSNDGGNLLAVAKQTLLCARVLPVLTSAPPGLMPVADVFRLATIGGAELLRRSTLGHLGAGAAADFAMFRSDDIELAGAAAQDPLAALILCDPGRADRVYVDGRAVVLDGRIVGLDETALGQRMNDLVAKRFRKPS